jgi:Cu/Ag efflux protein CusF
MTDHVNCLPVGPAGGTEGARTMREIFSAAVFVLLVAAAGPAATAAGTDQADPSGSTGSTAEKVITGTVDSFDKDTGAVVINGKTLYITANGEMALPNVGQKVTYVYEQRDGRNVVTSFRLGQ